MDRKCRAAVDVFVRNWNNIFEGG